MQFLTRVCERLIYQKSVLIGHDKIHNSCKKIIKLIHSPEKNSLELCNELDIKSINIFYGETGTGKTTLSYALAKYAIEEFNVETFELKFEDIITTELGKTLKNFHLAYAEIYKASKTDHGIVLLIDEIDRLLINREQSNETSEMKRAFISFMDFLQSISLENKITILATTNCFELFDPALKRRFPFQHKVKSNRKHINQYVEILSKKINNSYNYNIPKAYIKKSKTIAELKKKVRSDIVHLLQGD